MSGENRMRKRRNRIYRRIAVALTVALLAGQSHAFVLAEESNVALGNEILDEKTVGADDVEVDGGRDDSGEGNGDTENSGGENDSTDHNGDDYDSGSNNDEEGADMDNGDANVGEDAESTVETPGGGVETVPEDGDGLEETGSDGVTEENDVDLYADEGLNEEFDFVVNDIRYRITGENEVTVARQDYNLSGEVTIPGNVDNAGTTYHVTTIGFQAFTGCADLTGIKILNGVTNIGREVFVNCEKLKSVDIPDSVTNIGGAAFVSCKSLEHIEIPDKVTIIESSLFWDCSGLKSVKIPSSVTSIRYDAFRDCSSLISIETLEGVTSIEEYAFSGCRSLISIETLYSVTSIGKEAFRGCSSLISIETLEGVTSIAEAAFDACSSLKSIRISNSIGSLEHGVFESCTNLSRLYIVVPLNTSETVPKADFGTFYGDPVDRLIIFLAEDGTELTGEAFEKAKAAYLGDDSDGSRGDDFWWGWKIKDPSAADDTYQVTIAVRKDNSEWTGHNRTFALTKDNGLTFVKDLSAVEAGTYSIYDVTGLAEDAYQTGGVDTGITVGDTNKAATVDYYTVTFYDGVADYPAGTPQEPQIVLLGYSAKEPEPPRKTGYRFDGWKTEDGGSTAFVFNKAVNDTTGVYASWKDDSTPVAAYIIDASSGEGGSINPSGTVSVKEGESQQFTITPDDGYRIKAVTVDGADKTEELLDSVTKAQTGASKAYTFQNVRKNHTIAASFEREIGSGDDNTGDDDNQKDDTPGDEKKPDGGSGGNNSDGGENSVGENSEGSNTGNTLSTEVLAAASPQAAKDPAVNNQASDGISDKTVAGSKEPKTGDTTHAEVYATIAMIAGLTYLLLYFMEEGRGMSEREKDAFVAAFIRWAKKGGTFRRCCAMAAIFCLLTYYHSIGKRTDRNGFNEKYLGQVS